MAHTITVTFHDTTTHVYDDNFTDGSGTGEIARAKCRDLISNGFEVIAGEDTDVYCANHIAKVVATKN